MNLKRMISKCTALAVAGMMAVPCLSYAQQDIEKNIEFFNATKSYIIKNYAADEITEEELIDAAVKGMFDALDKHSVYMDAEENEEFSEEVEGSFVGIGALVGVRDGNITVLEPLEDSPAIEAGLLPGDIIRAIDGEEIVDPEDIKAVVKRIRGEEGTTVKLTIERGGRSFDVLVKRAEVELNPVKYKDLGNGIGYIKLSEFSKVSIKNMGKAVEDLKGKGTDKLILDLRGNPGGGLVDVVAIAQDFVPKGKIVTIKYKNGSENSYPSYGEPAFSKVAVLVDNGSASASEILAGAIQDTNSGILIGKNTYGKGTVQKLLPLKNGEAIKLTIAKYLLPSGRSIDQTGLVPDLDTERFASEIVDVEKLTPFETDHTMKKGDAGLDVLALQERLKLLGYEISDPQGIYGDSTAEGVNAYQVKLEIGQSGQADTATLSSISGDFSKFMLSDEMDNQLQKAMEYLGE